MCPVCRALFFGTRNYAMEELIANVRKLRAFKLGGKITTGTDITDTSAPQNAIGEIVNDQPEEEEENDDVSETSSTAAKSCKGFFRCLCCKDIVGERLPAARLLNHLRYYHAPDLLEGKSENGEYVQLWQFSTAPGRIVTAVRVSDMGIFFLIIEITNESISAWLSMAASPWIAHVFSYTLTISGNDREAIFTDCVWSVRSCEGSLKKRGHCLALDGIDAHALTAPASISGKLCIRKTPADQDANQSQPRAVLRVASRGNARENGRTVSHDMQPFIQDLQNDVNRISLAFATLGREANALAERSEAQMRARTENANQNQPSAGNDRSTPSGNEPQAAEANNQPDNAARAPLSRNARRRMRQRLRAVLNAPQPPVDMGPSAAQRPNGLGTQRQNGHALNNPIHFISGLAIVNPVTPPPVSPPSLGNTNRTNRRRRQRR
ncbi:uncharacterized protein LOC106138707 isoform X2 [Amyelois transitella]|nr:uncharacterized protein LOC106138707 isoform X2 [Amyelois transitella]